MADAAGGPKATVAPRRTRELIAWISAAAALAAAIVAGIFYRSVPADPRVYRSEIVPPALVQGDPSDRFALSPDGRRLAFLANGAGGRRLLWVRSLDSVSAQSLAGTEDATYPFWSPDNRFLAFIAGGKLKRIEAAGGSVITLADSGNSTGAWSRDDVILFTPRQGSSALFRIPGTVCRLRASGASASPRSSLNFQASGGGKTVPYAGRQRAARVNTLPASVAGRPAQRASVARFRVPARQRRFHLVIAARDPHRFFWVGNIKGLC